jgi:hypothetical protein
MARRREGMTLVRASMSLRRASAMPRLPRGLTSQSRKTNARKQNARLPTPNARLNMRQRIDRKLARR